MARYVELRRHTDNDDDVLSDDGVGQALEIGTGLRGDYDVFVSSGAQRATQAAACFLAGYGRPVPAGVIVEPGLRSDVEDRWRAQTLALPPSPNRSRIRASGTVTHRYRSAAATSGV